MTQPIGPPITPSKRIRPAFAASANPRPSPDKSPTRFEMSRTWSRHGLGGLKSRGNARALPLGPLIHTLEASLPSKPPANGPSRAQRFAP